MLATAFPLDTIVNGDTYRAIINISKRTVNMSTQTREIFVSFFTKKDFDREVIITLTFMVKLVARTVRE